MTGPVDEEKELARNRTTLMLIVGGTASLLIPLIGVAYMHWKDIRAAAPSAAPSSAVFEHRGVDGSGAAVAPAVTPAPDPNNVSSLAQVPNMPLRQSSPAPISAGSGSMPGGSLGYVRASDDFKAQQPAAPAAPPPVQQQPQPPAQQPAAQTSVGALAAKRAKPAPKAWNMPHLRASGFGGTAPQQGMPGQGMGGMGAGMGGMQGGAGGGAPNMAAMMQQMQGQGGAGGGGAPNMAAMMQQMQGQGGAGAGGGGVPNMGAMMQQMQQQGGAGQGAGGGGMPNMGAMMQQMQQQGGAGQGAGGGGMPNMGQMMQQMQGQQPQQQQ